jgi:hypothetical protein
MVTYMIKPHDGTVKLFESFNDVWKSLKEDREVSLETVREKTPFTAKATVAQKGKHPNERAIVIYQGGTRHIHAYIYDCCWGHQYNCSRTWIGMYCEALDNSLRG